MQKQHKDILRNIVTNLRRRLAGSYDAGSTLQRGDLDRELERLGVAPDGTVTPADALASPSPADLRAHQAADARLAGVKGGSARVQVRGEILERAAYTWINRLLALRSMEARRLIDETLRPNAAYDGISEALYLLRHTELGRAQGPDGGWWAVIDDACRTYADLLPGLFDPGDPNAALRPSTPALLDCLRSLSGQLPNNTTYALDEVEATFRDPDVLGWAYQFYQAEAKDRVYAKLGAGGKVETRAEIAAATQLFTEPYMVKWLLQNSLGRSYAEAYPDSKLPATWEYYIRREEVLAQAGADTSAAPGEGGGGADDAEVQPLPLAELTLLDPCMGSGHILREGFDMLYAMYAEQEPGLDAAEIARRILSRHLYGIDIDPRAAQLAGLTLVLRAWETAQAQDGAWGAGGQPVRTALNLAATPSLTPGSLDRHLAHHPEDKLDHPLLAGTFTALEQAPLLGSLLRPEEHLDTAIAAFQKQGKQLALLGEQTAANRRFEELNKQDSGELKRLLIERVRRSLARETQKSDVGAQLLGREAGEGMNLLRLLEHKYAVVCTNPPYMGSSNMDAQLKRYVEHHYRAGKRDLYAAFILRCLELCRHAGRVAMITQQSWMFLKSYADLRAVPEDALAQTKQKREFTGLIRETCIEALAHLGPNAFEEISGEVVQNAMFTLANCAPETGHRLVALRVTSSANSVAKAKRLEYRGIGAGDTFTIDLKNMLQIDRSPIAYWLPSKLIGMFHSLPSVREFAFVRQGICTTNNQRFVRCSWEADLSRKSGTQKRWTEFAKGGGIAFWTGFEQDSVDWEFNGVRVKTYQEEKPGAIHWSGRMPEDSYLYRSGWTFTRVGRGTLALRSLDDKTLFCDTSPAVIPYNIGNLELLGFWLNSRLASFLLRSLTQSLDCREGYVQRLPVPTFSSVETIHRIVHRSVALHRLLTSIEPRERAFLPFYPNRNENVSRKAESHYLLTEGVREAIIFRAAGLDLVDVETVTNEVGSPAGWHPFVSGYDRLPDLDEELGLPPISRDVLDYLTAHKRITPTCPELARIKDNLRILYELGKGVNHDDVDLEEFERHDDGGDDDMIGSYIPISTETFLEELSTKLQVHPISVYWLLEELHTEGVRCKPEEKRLLEDRLSVIVMRLLGHRWPKQMEAGEHIQAWADADGVIPLIPFTGEVTLEERVRARLRDEDGDLGAQRCEALLVELTSRTLSEWLRRDFFRRHVSQFKKRPIAWHLASTPAAGARSRRSAVQPAFECMVYYHRTPGDILARIRTQYVELLLARQRVAQVQASSDTEAAVAAARIQELEDFAARLRRVEEEGFACPELDDLLATEPLDRWSGDGITPPASQAALLVQEQAWTVDINDGVRVNIAPLQAAGLLAADVLNARDLRKAVADRARWRSDERRWVRAGKLPRCGWMADDIPESPKWTELAPQREAERIRLEEKRKAVGQLQM